MIVALEYIKDCISELENLFPDVFSVGSIDEDLKNNPFSHYLVYLERDLIVGFINYYDIYDRMEIANFNVLEQYMTIEKLKLVLMGMNKKYVFISNDKFNDLEVVGYDPDILKIINTYKEREPINPHFVNPIYLKLTEAEENRLKDN